MPTTHSMIAAATVLCCFIWHRRGMSEGHAEPTATVLRRGQLALPPRSHSLRRSPGRRLPSMLPFGASTPRVQAPGWTRNEQMSAGSSVHQEAQALAMLWPTFQKNDRQGLVLTAPLGIRCERPAFVSCVSIRVLAPGVIALKWSLLGRCLLDGCLSECGLGGGTSCPRRNTAAAARHPPSAHDY